MKALPCRVALATVLILSSAWAALAQNVDVGRIDGIDADWQGYGRTSNENHYSPLTQISVASVSRLSLAWFHELDNGRADSQPVEAGGTVFVAMGQSIIRAMDARTGKLIWRYDSKAGDAAGNKLRASWGTRGLAYWDHRVFAGTHDGRLIALDALTGRLLWSQQVLDRGDETTITGAPRLFNGRILMGFAGGDRNATRGAVVCFDAKTGLRLWQFFTVPGDPGKGFENDAMRMAAATWSGDWWKSGGGAAVWNAMTYDAEFDRVYIGTGNANPWNSNLRNPKGLDNLFTASIVALNAATGEYVWHYQENPNDAWDFDSAMDIELAHLSIDGVDHRVLLHAPKNGFVYVIDRQDGQLLSANKIGRVTWADRIDLKTGRPIEAPGIRYQDHSILVWPSYNGAHNWPPMAFSPSDELLFIPTIDQANYFNTDGVDLAHWAPQKNMWTMGVGDLDHHVPREQFGGSLLAWDPVGGRELWRVPTPSIWSGGVMATAGKLVFQGHMDGTFNAFDSRTGQKVWSFNAGTSVLGPPISYAVDGTQYVTVVSGPPMGPAAYLFDTRQFGWRYRDHPRRVLTFALDGGAALPPPVPAGPVSPLTDGPPADPDKAKAGLLIYAFNCAGCHGPNTVSSGGTPDLRASAIVTAPAAFALVLNGALVNNGMPRFAEFTPADIENLRQYVRQQAQSAGHGVSETVR